MKTKRFKQFVTEEAFPVNKGHAYEFVLAAAMVSRFTDRFDDGTAQPLTADSVEDVMKNYYRGNVYYQVDEGDDEVDIVEFDGTGLPADVIDALKDDKIRRGPVVKKMIADAIGAVNANGTLKKLSDEVISNGKPDDIEVRCGGTKGQMATKSDVDVYVNDSKQRKAGFSVKYGGTKQAGQFAGRNPAQNLVNGFKSFGMDVGRLPGMKKVQTAFESLVADYESRKDPVIDKDKAAMFGAVTPLYQQIIKKFDSRYISKGKNAENIMSGLLKANTGKEDDLDLIRSSISFDRKTFKAISDLLADAAKQGNAEFKLESGSNPTIGLYANGTQLFTIRFRYDADKRGQRYVPRFRLLVENGPYLDKLAASLS